MREIKHSPIYPDTSAIDRDWLPNVVFVTVFGGTAGALIHFAWSVLA